MRRKKVECKNGRVGEREGMGKQEVKGKGNKEEIEREIEGEVHTHAGGARHMRRQVVFVTREGREKKEVEP